MFRGTGTALVTPFTADGALDEAALADFVEWQIAERIDFLVPCGTTGENPTLTADEHRRVVEITVATSDGRVPVLAGAGSNSTVRAVELARQAVDLGADGILTITPYYNKPNTDGLVRHFAAQAEAVEKQRAGFPMIVYNVPGRTGLNMTAQTTLRIAAEVPNVIGIKEASANMEQILEIVRLRQEGFLVLSGDDAWTVALIGAGADGLISVASNEIPALMVEMVRAALEEDFASARALQNRLLPLLVGNFMESNPVPAKAAMVMLGILEHDTVRPPLAPISTANREALRVILEECGLIHDAS